MTRTSDSFIKIRFLRPTVKCSIGSTGHYGKHEFILQLRKPFCFFPEEHVMTKLMNVSCLFNVRVYNNKNCWKVVDTYKYTLLRTYRTNDLDVTKGSCTFLWNLWKPLYLSSSFIWRYRQDSVVHFNLTRTNLHVGNWYMSTNQMRLVKCSRVCFRGTLAYCGIYTKGETLCGMST